MLFLIGFKKKSQNSNEHLKLFAEKLWKCPFASPIKIEFFFVAPYFRINIFLTHLFAVMQK